ncbi:MAG: hypothetical protein L0Z50_35605, partial [Verrucomicrobiales bacterium]|nr:hypothetical protein [Verrucomicrobiales bacterium]
MRSQVTSEAEAPAIAGLLKEALADPAQPEFWLSRLVHRKYTDLAKPTWPRQYSARIEYQGAGFYFPLGSDDLLRAAQRAREIYETVITRGWRAAFQRYSREITLSIFWRRHPIACTYTTLYTEPRGLLEIASSSRRAKGSGRKVLLIEPDPVLRATLQQWLEGLSINDCVGSFPSAREALRSAELRQADLCLFNQHLPDLSEPEATGKLRSSSLGFAAFGYGIYEQSDDIFASMSGVQEGYYLRRRSPGEMLDPIQAAQNESAAFQHQLDCGITRYFQDLFVVQSPQHRGPES